MLNRRQFFLGVLAAASMPAMAQAQPQMPSAEAIIRSLQARPRGRIEPDARVTIEQFKRRPELRHRAPSIDIQAINFAFDSARISPSQYYKVERIADALHHIRRRRGRAYFLIEGHTDAVGSRAYNQQLSERRAWALRSLLVRRFGIPAPMLEAVGYGEEYLLVPTPFENWRNRRVTLRRIDDFVF